MTSPRTSSPRPTPKYHKMNSPRRRKRSLTFKMINRIRLKHLLTKICTVEKPAEIKRKVMRSAKMCRSLGFYLKKSQRENCRMEQQILSKKRIFAKIHSSHQKIELKVFLSIQKNNCHKLTKKLKKSGLQKKRHHFQKNSAFLFLAVHMINFVKN